MKKITTTLLKERQYLYNTEAPTTFDYGNQDFVILEAGETVNVLVDRFPDGRVYYTAFTVKKGTYYCYTHMKDANGALILNCGGHRMSYELQQLFKKGKFKAVATTPADIHVHCTRLKASEWYYISPSEDPNFVVVCGTLYDKDGGSEKVYDKHLAASRVWPFIAV